MSDKDYKSPITVKEEEIDLGKLFSLIGKLFSNLIKNIGLLFKGFFHYFILLLIFLKGHIFKLSIFIFFGAITGFFVDFIKPEKYTYDMIINPNYQSIDQIYENIEYYNVLIDNQDSIALAQEFDINFKTANNLISFELITYDTEKDKLLAFDKFIKETDTLTQKHFTYLTFKGDKASKFDSYKYVYRVQSYSVNLKSFEDKIIGDIEKNPTLQKKRRIKLNTLKLDSIRTWKAIEDVNSLRELNEKVTLLEVEKNKITPNTHIDFSAESTQNNDIELFNIENALNKNLIKIEKEKEMSDNIVNIITTFNKTGKRIGTIYQTRMFRFGSIFGAAILFFILIKMLNEYLNRYQSKNS